MERLEDKIRKNAELFNDSEPSAEHLSHFAKLLEKRHNTKRITFWQTTLKIAATAIILISVSYFTFYQFNKQKSQPSTQITQIEYSDDMDEVLNFYDAASTIKAEEIEQYALNPEQALIMRKKASRQLENLDAKLAEIEKEYMKNPENKNLRAALVNTKRKKSEVMNQIVKQMEIAHSGLYSINTETIQF